MQSAIRTTEKEVTAIKLNPMVDKVKRPWRRDFSHPEHCTGCLGMFHYYTTDALDIHYCCYSLNTNLIQSIYL